MSQCWFPPASNTHDDVGFDSLGIPVITGGWDCLSGAGGAPGHDVLPASAGRYWDLHRSRQRLRPEGRHVPLQVTCHIVHLRLAVVEGCMKAFISQV